MTIDEIKKKLQPMNLSEVARMIEGVHYNTIYSLSRATSLKGFNYETIQKVVKFLKGN